MGKRLGGELLISMLGTELRKDLVGSRDEEVVGGRDVGLLIIVSPLLMRRVGLSTLATCPLFSNGPVAGSEGL